jgi:hypothetical protein
MKKSVPEQKSILQAYINKIGTTLSLSSCSPSHKSSIQTPILSPSLALCGSESLSTPTSSPSSDLLTRGECSLSLLWPLTQSRDGTKVRQHLDAINCLIPLMGKPKVGLQAKEALLVAVAMHDRRVDRFILTETNLARNIVSEMVKKFVLCLSTSATFTPITPATSGVRRDDKPSSPSSTAVDNTSRTSIISFLKVLKFCSAFVAAASDEGGTEELDGFISIEEDASCASLQSTVCEQYCTLFLLECVRPALLENGEHQVLIAQSLVRSILLELSPTQRDPAQPLSSAAHLLCAPTTALLCDDKELLQAILPRAGSVSRAVSVSTLQFLSTVLGAASMRECCRLVLAPEETSKESALEQSPVTPSKSLDIDTTLNRVISASATRFGSIPWVGRSNGHGLRENCSTNYLEAGLDRILSRLAGGVQCQGSEALLRIDPNIFPVNGSRPVGGPLLELTKRKLASFLTLKYDEQVAVTGLVEKCVSILSTLLVLSGSDPMGNVILKLFIGLFEAVSERVSELATHMKSLSDAPQKLEIISAVLNEPNCDPRYRRLIDSESAQVVRILETSLIVREMYREFEGCLFAVRQLRMVLTPQGSVGLLSNTQSPSSTPTDSSYSLTPHQTPNSLTPGSPFLSHSSPFSHAVQSSIHFAQHEDLFYSDSDTDDDHEDDNHSHDEEGESHECYHLTDEELEERFLHEFTLYERDLKSILNEAEGRAEDGQELAEGNEGGAY